MSYKVAWRLLVALAPGFVAGLLLAQAMGDLFSKRRTDDPGSHSLQGVVKEELDG